MARVAEPWSRCWATFEMSVAALNRSVSQSTGIVVSTQGWSSDLWPFRAVAECAPAGDPKTDDLLVLSVDVWRQDGIAASADLARGNGPTLSEADLLAGWTQPRTEATSALVDAVCDAMASFIHAQAMLVRQELVAR